MIFFRGIWDLTYFFITNSYGAIVLTIFYLIIMYHFLNIWSIVKIFNWIWIKFIQIFILPNFKYILVYKQTKIYFWNHIFSLWKGKASVSSEINVSQSCPQVFQLTMDPLFPFQPKTNQNILAFLWKNALKTVGVSNLIVVAPSILHNEFSIIFHSEREKVKGVFICITLSV